MFHQQQWGPLDDDSADIGYGPESLKSFFESILDPPEVEVGMGGEKNLLGRNTLEHDIFTSQDSKNELHEIMPVQESHKPKAQERLAERDTKEDKDDISQAVSLLVRGRSITQGLGDVLLSSMASFNGLSAISDRLQPSVRAYKQKKARLSSKKRASSQFTRLPTREKSKRIQRRKTIRRAVKRTKKKKTIKKRKTAIPQIKKGKPFMKISKRNSCPACRGRRRKHTYVNDCFKVTSGKRAYKKNTKL